MIHIDSLMWLLPITFMFHDFEEIIFLPLWLKKNKDYIINKYPRIGKRIFSRFERISSASFAIAVFEEFIILSGLTFLCVEYNYYSFFTVLTIVYLIHVIGHVVQSLALKKYIPAVGTAILTGIYNVYTIYILNVLDYLNWKFILVTVPPVFLIMVINIFFAHWLSDKCAVT